MKFLTTREAATLMGVSAYTVRRYIRDKKIAAWKFTPSRTLRIPLESVLNLINQSRISTGGDHGPDDAF